MVNDSYIGEALSRALCEFQAIYISTLLPCIRLYCFEYIYGSHWWFPSVRMGLQVKPLSSATLTCIVCSYSKTHTFTNFLFALIYMCVCVYRYLLVGWLASWLALASLLLHLCRCAMYVRAHILHWTNSQIQIADHEQTRDRGRESEKERKKELCGECASISRRLGTALVCLPGFESIFSPT